MDSVAVELIFKYGVGFPAAVFIVYRVIIMMEKWLISRSKAESQMTDSSGRLTSDIITMVSQTNGRSLSIQEKAIASMLSIAKMVSDEGEETRKLVESLGVDIRRVTLQTKNTLDSDFQRVIDGVSKNSSTLASQIGQQIERNTDAIQELRIAVQELRSSVTALQSSHQKPPDSVSDL